MAAMANAFQALASTQTHNKLLSFGSGLLRLVTGHPGQS